MREPMKIEDFEAAVEEKKRLGLGARPIADLRNDGSRRSPKKREMLARMAERAKEAGLEPYSIS